MSGAGKWMIFEIENNNKLVGKEKLELGVKKYGLLCGLVIIEVAENVNIKKLEQLNQDKNELIGSYELLEEKYEVKGFPKQYLEDGFVTVEVVSKMSMNMSHVEEERIRKVNVVEVITKELMACEDHQFDCHNPILSARSLCLPVGLPKWRRESQSTGSSRTPPHSP